ncbi:hypothetical protein AHAS_Ahas20G0083000 [Arachis hypogaea]
MYFFPMILERMVTASLSKRKFQNIDGYWCRAAMTITGGYMLMTSMKIDFLSWIPCIKRPKEIGAN